MDFQLIDKILCESRLYRYTHNFNQLEGKDIANLLYLNTLATYMLTLDDETHTYGINYAKTSSQYGNYSLFRTHGTDLYLLAYLVSNPDNDHIKLDRNIQSKKFLESLKFLPRMHWRFMTDVAHFNVHTYDAYSMFYRLETQLKITDGKYRRWRRLILDWNNLKDIQKQLVIVQIVQEFRRIGRGSELLVPLSNMLTDRHYGNYSVAPAPEIVSVVPTEIGTGTKTGLGAIADYWNSRRKVS